jgi:hypothetical protein
MNEQEEMALRELAAKPHYLPQVAAALGPLSLWSKAVLESEIRRAVEAEREACAKLMFTLDLRGEEMRAAQAIRARGTT